MSTTAPFENSVKESFANLQKYILNCNKNKSTVNLEEAIIQPYLLKLEIGKREIKKAQPITYPGMDATTINNLIFIQLISAIMKKQIDLDFLQEFFFHHEKNQNDNVFTEKKRPEAYKDVWTEHHYQHYYHMTTLLLNAYKECRESLIRTKADLYATCKRIQQNIEQLRLSHIKLSHEIRRLIEDKNDAIKKKQEYKAEIIDLKEKIKEQANNKENNKTHQHKINECQTEIKTKQAHIDKLDVIIENIRKEGKSKIALLKTSEQKEIEDLASLRIQKQKLDIIDKELDKNKDAMEELGLNMGTQDNTYSFDTTSILNLFKENKLTHLATGLEANLINDIDLNIDIQAGRP